ncbi:MAG: tRNA (adenine-N1)-methyltransferase [Acidimicrobiia bacterium]|nr:tRNA (adenine-N1)-methyltransferase [Acidimicrobiia bacterium]MDH5236460.1 tRNA (adenine-N1)-methyltransferase [Acidimicrobiia bacterium]
MSTFGAGDEVMLVDRKNRRYLFTLVPGEEFHSHAGIVGHDLIIGRPEGSPVASSRGARYTAIKPTLSEFVLKMPRGAQVIYPKDLGPILLLADIAPGVRVFESGIGSGATSTTLLRVGADIVGYELREDFAARAEANVRRFLGDAFDEDRYQLHIRDAYEGIDHGPFDRAILDLPEPWRMTPHLATALRPGGIVVAYTPSMVQVQQFRAALAEGPYALAETLEVLHRGWHVEGAAVRPDHRMVAHTGFLTHARRIGA